jgi:hypothetical protein
VRFVTGLVWLFVALIAMIVLPAVAATKGASTGAGGSADDGDGPKPAASPVIIHFRQPVVFTLSLGKDATTNAEVAVAVAARMKRNDDGSARQTTFVPEGGWGLNDFLEQCKEDPYTTLGAIIVLPSTFESRADNYLLMIRSVSTLQFNALVATCNPISVLVPAASPAPPGAQTGRAGASPPSMPSLTPMPSPTGTLIVGDAGVDWVSDTAVGTYGRSVIQFTPLAVLTSVYLAFAPQRLYQTVGTRVFPTPNPIPAGGAQNSVVTTTQTTLNPTGTATLQNSVVNTVGVAELLFGRSAGIEHFTMHAAEDAATRFVKTQFQSKCDGWGKPQTVPSASPNASPAPAPTPTALPSAWFNRTPAPVGPVDLRSAPAASPAAFCSW